MDAQEGLKRPRLGVGTPRSFRLSFLSKMDRRGHGGPAPQSTLQEYGGIDSEILGENLDVFQIQLPFP
jgi:hypothetical protein